MPAALGVPYCFVAEHLVQVGSYHVLADMSDEEKRRELEQHLIRVHLLGSEMQDDEDILRLGG